MRIVDEISPKKLKELYWERNMSSPEIAKIYKCTPEYVRDLFKKYGVRTRTKSEAKRLFYNISIPKKTLKILYLKKMLSSVDIAKEFKRSPGLVRNRLREYKIPIRTHYEAHLLCNQPRYERHDFDGGLEEKAYLIGFRRGDLYVYQARPRTIVVSMSSTKSAQLNLFQNLFSKYGHIWQGKKRIDNYGDIPICCYLNNTFEFLLDKKDLIEPWILKNTNYFAAFLAGYSDAEGSFCLCKGNGVFEIRSNDKNILQQIRDKLINLEILLRPLQIVRKKGTVINIMGTARISNKDCWGIFIHRKDALLKLINLVNPYLKHLEKRRSMWIVKNNVLERNKKYNNRQDAIWYKLYLMEGVKI